MVDCVEGGTAKQRRLHSREMRGREEGERRENNKRGKAEERKKKRKEEGEDERREGGGTCEWRRWRRWSSGEWGGMGVGVVDEDGRGKKDERPHWREEMEQKGGRQRRGAEETRLNGAEDALHDGICNDEGGRAQPDDESGGGGVERCWGGPQRRSDCPEKVPIPQ